MFDAPARVSARDSFIGYDRARGGDLLAHTQGLGGRALAVGPDVRRATHTPPMRSGKRVTSLSLDDGSEPVSTVVFFHDAQAQIGAPVLRTQYALIRAEPGAPAPAACQ